MALGRRGHNVNKILLGQEVVKALYTNVCPSIALFAQLYWKKHYFLQLDALQALYCDLEFSQTSTKRAGYVCSDKCLCAHAHLLRGLAEHAHYIFCNKHTYIIGHCIYQNDNPLAGNIRRFLLLFVLFTSLIPLCCPTSDCSSSDDYNCTHGVYKHCGRKSYKIATNLLTFLKINN